MDLVDSCSAMPARGSAPCPAARAHLDEARSAPGTDVREIFRKRGGLATADEVAVLLSQNLDQPISRVARWIVRGEVILLRDGAQWLLPLFQFDLAAGRVRAEILAELEELRPFMDDHEIAAWFAVRLRAQRA